MGGRTLVGLLARSRPRVMSPGTESGRQTGNDCKPAAGSPFASLRLDSDPIAIRFRAFLKRNGRQTFGPPTPCNACLLSKADPYGSPRKAHCGRFSSSAFWARPTQRLRAICHSGSVSVKQKFLKTASKAPTPWPASVFRRGCSATRNLAGPAFPDHRRAVVIHTVFINNRRRSTRAAPLAGRAEKRWRGGQA